jgi:hypothetical protein
MRRSRTTRRRIRACYSRSRHGDRRGAWWRCLSAAYVIGCAGSGSGWSRDGAELKSEPEKRGLVIYRMRIRMLSAALLRGCLLCSAAWSRCCSYARGLPRVRPRTADSGSAEPTGWERAFLYRRMGPDLAGPATLITRTHFLPLLCHGGPSRTDRYRETVAIAVVDERLPRRERQVEKAMPVSIASERVVNVGVIECSGPKSPLPTKPASSCSLAFYLACSPDRRLTVDIVMRA